MEAQAVGVCFLALERERPRADEGAPEVWFLPDFLLFCGAASFQLGRTSSLSTWHALGKEVGSGQGRGGCGGWGA